MRSGRKRRSIRSTPPIEWIMIDQGEGRWCPRCFLPAVHWQAMAMVDAITLRVRRRAEFKVCRSGCQIEDEARWLE